MINKINITKDLLEITEKNFYEGRINSSLHEDVAVVFTDPRLFKLFKYNEDSIHIARPRGLVYALRYTYDQTLQNMGQSMRSQVSNFMLNTIITVIENKVKEKFPSKEKYKAFDVSKGEFDASE